MVLPLLIRWTCAEHSDVLVACPPSGRSVVNTCRRGNGGKHRHAAHNVLSHCRKLRLWSETNCRFIGSGAAWSGLFSAALVLKQKHAAHQLACGSVVADIGGSSFSGQRRRVSTLRGDEEAVRHTHTVDISRMFF